MPKYKNPLGLKRRFFTYLGNNVTFIGQLVPYLKVPYGNVQHLEVPHPKVSYANVMCFRVPCLKTSHVHTHTQVSTRVLSHWGPRIPMPPPLYGRCRRTFCLNQLRDGFKSVLRISTKISVGGIHSVWTSYWRRCVSTNLNAVLYGAKTSPSDIEHRLLNYIYVHIKPYIRHLLHYTTTW